MSKDPSVLQVEYAKQLSNMVMDDILRSMRDNQREIRKFLTGNQGSSQIVELPEAVVHGIAADAAERLRRSVLHYFREIGSFPE